MLFNSNNLGTPDDNRKKNKKRKSAKQAEKQSPIKKIGLAVVIAMGIIGIPAMIAFATYAQEIVLK